MVYHDVFYQLYSDVEVKSIKDSWYINDTFSLVRASEVEGVNGKLTNVHI